MNRWTSWRVRRRLALAAFWQGRADLDEACRHARHAYRLARRLPVVPAAEITVTLARLEQGRDRAEAALALLNETVRRLDSAPVTDGRDRILSLALTALGDAHRRAARYPQATHALRRALEFAEAGKETGPVTAALTLLGITAKELGSFAEAAAHYARVTDLHRMVGASLGDAASLAHNLAGLALAQQQNTEAEEHARRAVALRREAPEAHPVHVAEDLAVLAAALAGLHHYDQAATLLHEAMRACREATPPRRYELSVQLHNLASVEHAAGRAGRAERNYRAARALKEQLLGADHPEVALVDNNLATLLYEQHRAAEAQQCLHRALAVIERVYPSEHPTTLAVRANLHRVQADIGRP